MVDEPETISAKDAASLIKVSERYLRRLVADGWITKTASDHYTVGNVVSGRIGQLRAQIRKAEDRLAGNRKDAARIREIEARTARMGAGLIHVDEAIETLEEIVQVLRKEAVVVPAQVACDARTKALLQEAIDGAFHRADARIEIEKARRYARQLRAAGESSRLFLLRG